jgi:iron(III) transport system ATP-binding protein
MNTLKTEPAATRAAVSIRGLRKVYRTRGRSVVGVDSVDLDVGPGELVVLLGPSGCGKTTLLRSVAGLETPDEGEISIDGRHVFSARDKLFLPPEDRRLGMMFQSYALWPHMTVYQNVAYPLSSQPSAQRGDVRARVHDALSRLGVAGMEERFPSELSGGQQQRVALARALIGRPSVILFDEPLSNVDAKVRRRLRQQLRDLKQETRFSGIYVTHDQEEAMELADRLAVMDTGRIAQLGTSREVYERPNSLYVAGFVGEVNQWPAEIMSTNGATAVARTSFGDFSVGASNVAVGAKGSLAIRPERVRLVAPGANAASADPRTRGTVREIVFLGARCEARIALKGEEAMAWIFEAVTQTSPLNQGAEVDVMFEAANLQWLTA